MLIQVKVKPNSKVRKIVQIEKDNYIVHVNAPATEGKANLELIKLLSKEFGVAKSKVELVKGLKSNNKLVEIEI